MIKIYDYIFMVRGGESYMATIMQQRTYMRTTGSLDILVGIWLILAPFLLGYSGNNTALWNDVILGIAVVIFSATQTAGASRRISWPSWVNILAGIWLVLAPFALGYSFLTVALWNDIISGIIIIALAAFAAFSSSPTDRMYDDRV